MAQLNHSGLADLELSLKEIAELPVSVHDEMLSVMAEATAEGQRQKARSYLVKDSGKTIKSIKPGRIKTDRDGRRVVYVTVSGIRKRGKKTIRKVRNAEIAFINEYGKKGQKARRFVRDGNEASAEAATNAAKEIYDRHLRSKNL